MWLSKRSLKKHYEEELLKQTDPYTYYIGACEEKINSILENEGVHESVPFICMNKENGKNDTHNIYEYGDYYIYEDKNGFSSDEEKMYLVTIAEKLNADLIYSDSDCITCDGKRHMPFYKPDFSIDTFKCFDYISEFYAVRKNKSKADIQLLENVSHVTKVLFHWNKEMDAEENENRYILNNNSYKTDDFYIDNIELGTDKNKISVIIPSKDNPKLIEMCLSGLQKAIVKSRINTLEVLIVDNGSTEEHRDEISGVIDKSKESDGLSVKYYYEPSEFNFSAMCNMGAKESSGDYLLFMNDDIEVVDELFLLKLLHFAKMDHIGAVGCKLLYPGDEKRIQHVGITCLKYAGPSHKLSTFPDDKPLYFGRNIGVHNCLAVTGACLMVSREKYFKIGGFHDKMKVGYNDVDLCVSLYEKGYLNVVNNDAVLIHHESISRGSDAKSEEKLKRLDAERNLLYERHPWILEDGDPFYNPNLAGDFLDYRVNVIPDFERRDYVSMERKELDKYVHAEPFSSKNLFFNIENRAKNREYFDITGWALINKKDNYLFDTFLCVITSDGKKHVFETASVYRADLKSVFPDAAYVDLSGFFARIPCDVICGDIGNITSKFGILLINKKTGKKYYAGFNESDI